MNFRQGGDWIKMATPRQPCPPTTAALDDFAALFDPLFNRLSQRCHFRAYLAGLLMPVHPNKALTNLAQTVEMEGISYQGLHHFLTAAGKGGRRRATPPTIAARSPDQVA
jgi:hypothetical protein